MRTPWSEVYVDHGIHHFEARPDLRKPKLSGEMQVT